MDRRLIWTSGSSRSYSTAARLMRSSAAQISRPSKHHQQQLNHSNWPTAVPLSSSGQTGQCNEDDGRAQRDRLGPRPACWQLIAAFRKVDLSAACKRTCSHHASYSSSTVLFTRERERKGERVVPSHACVPRWCPLAVAEEPYWSCAVGGKVVN
ncbi:hypothetical protein BCV70DRAFT_88871 [Testicularia cyperi]|uniref:Uncharacterized protein n=1 Tax=Testicularia cyperi TaxID=1882483 RepID=A0A317XUK7_9BASI|nr:hypothetical protein BCV70DRAFT_88871 [Testicularia cyperi]